MQTRRALPFAFILGEGGSVVRDDERYSTNFYFCKHNARSVWFSDSAPPAIGMSIGDFVSAPH
jgi:hypothetical protein